MLVPFLLKYLICWYICSISDLRTASAWVAALLSFYPQYVALKITYQIPDPMKGFQKKRHHKRVLIKLEFQLENFCRLMFSLPQVGSSNLAKAKIEY